MEDVNEVAWKRGKTSWEKDYLPLWQTKHPGGTKNITLREQKTPNDIRGKKQTYRGNKNTLAPSKWDCMAPNVSKWYNMVPNGSNVRRWRREDVDSKGTMESGFTNYLRWFLYNQIFDLWSWKPRFAPLCLKDIACSCGASYVKKGRVSIQSGQTLT